MSDFAKINKVFVTENVIKQTLGWLREAGFRHSEATVLWAGQFATPERFMILTAIYPEQIALHSPHGVGYVVEGNELFRINKWLFENDRILLAQVHSHPTEAYHSDTDDDYPMVTAVGQFSIVVPFFARDTEMDFLTWAFYRLSGTGDWLEVPEDKVRQIFVKVVE